MSKGRQRGFAVVSAEQKGLYVDMLLDMGTQAVAVVFNLSKLRIGIENMTEAVAVYI